MAALLKAQNYEIEDGSIATLTVTGVDVKTTY